MKKLAIQIGWWDRFNLNHYHKVLIAKEKIDKSKELKED